MTIINNTVDLTSSPSGDEHLAFLNALLNDYITFDDAVYPQDYDRNLQPGDNGYVAPVIRKEWNASAAAAWGFANRAAVESALAVL
jgi:hypothetical protein